MKRESLMPREQKEIKRPFPLVRDLFAFARERGIDVRGFNSDTGEAHAIAPLPEKYVPLVEEYPGVYFVTAYEDRRGNYYAEGTRGQLVRLSTVEDRSVSDERTREIDIEEREGRDADRLKIRVREAVMDKSFGFINQARSGEVDRPNGSMRYTYERDEAGKKYPKLIECNRMDEGLFRIDGLEKPVRWVRDVRKEIEDGKTYVTEYRDYYVIGRNTKESKDERVSIKTAIRGDIQNPKLIEVEIGFGSKLSARRLVDDQAGGLIVLVHEEKMLSIARVDPAYAEIFKEKPEREKIILGIASRIQMLLDEWDKPQSVYEDMTRKISDEPRQIEDQD